MKVFLPKPGVLILEHGPWRNLSILFAFTTAFILWAFGKGVETGLVVSLLGFGFVWFGARRFEHVRVVFDKAAGRVAIRRRTVRHGASRARYALDEIGAVEAETVGTGKSTTYRLSLVIPEGPHAGRHPLNVYEINERGVPDHARAITTFLKQDK